MGLEIDSKKLEDLIQKKNQSTRGYLLQNESNQELLSLAPFLKNYIEGEGKKLLKKEVEEGGMKIINIVAPADQDGGNDDK